MADLPEADEFPAGITQIETTDPVEGGVAGIANRGLIQLAKRTRWLKNRIDESVATLFDAAGDYPSLRARATTAEDVGLGALMNYPLQHDPALGVAAEYASGAAARALYDMFGGIPPLPGDFAKNRLVYCHGMAPATLAANVCYETLSWPVYSAVAIAGSVQPRGTAGVYTQAMVNGAWVGSFNVPAGWHLRTEYWTLYNNG